MRILITGATGLVGSEIVSILKQTNTEIHFLSTSKDKLSGDNRIKGFYWDPQGGIMDENALIGVDAIIHLAGASIDHRWTEAYKQEIIESRVFSTNLLYTTLKHNPHQVTHCCRIGHRNLPRQPFKSLHRSFTIACRGFSGPRRSKVGKRSG